MSDTPKRAKGTLQWRVNRAIHLWFTTDMTQAEIGDELGVSRQTVNDYIHSPPADEVREQLSNQAVQVRMAAFAELRRHMREAGHRSRTAERPVKVWRNDEGTLNVREIRDDETGEVIKRIPVPADLVMGPDEEARFYARKEVREALDMLIDLVGAGEPEQIEVSGEVSHGADESLQELKDMAEDLF